MNNQFVFENYYDDFIEPEIRDSKKIVDIFLRRFDVEINATQAIRLWVKYSQDYEGIDWLSLPEEKEFVEAMVELMPALVPIEAD